ncbi:MAG TPA: dihydrolipoamide acetyltransferase family protein [Polyangiaceae bacterium]|jgi:pyruvate dehydrogenase E2 component (dihydrolipoamide acetyltransferase)|nr:dihydrolipoamide acetyltransferase family protein [Polyangiaceae bacterium]
MARWEFKLPDIGEGVTEGEVVQWLVHEGDIVKEDQPMVEVMTDKATVTIGAPRAGRIAELRGKAGQVVQVHSVLVVFELDATAPAVTAHANGHANGTKKDEGPAATAVGDIRESLPGMGGPPKAAPAAAPAQAASAVSSYFNDKPLATPATRKAARDLGIDLKSVKPTGAQGRVTKDDVVAHSHGLARGGAPASTPVSSSLQSHAAVAVARGEADERVPFVGMRRKIAAKMQQSTQTAAHFTFVEECDATALMEMRQRLKPAAEQQGVKLTFLPFIVKAVVLALRRRPILNSALDETTNELVYRKSHHIGIAASTDAGLMVPVVKDAGNRTILDIAREIERLGNDAKAGKSKPQDLSGSTFTITSLGAEGGLFATPIINFPEVGILGVHRIKERPVVKDGQIVIGNVMLLSLSFDHRIVDGHVGAAFAYDIIASLENPERMFLEMV